ncbi:hypothetical protein E2C01_086152 [Portunus trituberculatus]|uniref:Uncharacterized protein n=1 Tax=Portunus trituberculatus TaxID=210409 RepID=A0A5B7J8X3_PORTR|nr:hypothetical protein [Portunus trituberculatus]
MKNGTFNGMVGMVHRQPWYCGTMPALGSEGLQAHGFESCLRSECRLGFLTRDNDFLAGGL